MWITVGEASRERRWQWQGPDSGPLHRLGEEPGAWVFPGQCQETRSEIWGCKWSFLNRKLCNMPPNHALTFWAWSFRDLNLGLAGHSLLTLRRLPLPSLEPLAPVPPVAHKPRHSSWERQCPQGCGHVGGCASPQRPHPILTRSSGRKDGAGQAWLWHSPLPRASPCCHHAPAAPLTLWPNPEHRPQPSWDGAGRFRRIL